jgi:hypothetical protein
MANVGGEGKGTGIACCFKFERITKFDCGASVHTTIITYHEVRSLSQPANSRMREIHLSGCTPISIWSPAWRAQASKVFT